jgi:glycerol-3-phosphate O-acyltransferase / dihydroxyacetone phosphate acyltransferase
MTLTTRTLRLVTRVFFRRIEVTGLEHVPASGGGLVISWHPNAMIDAGLILTQFPRRIVFGARAGLFGWPLLGWVMRHIGTVPIHRGQDQKAGTLDTEHRAANAQSLDALALAVAEGAFAGLFPEGISHDDPSPRELKTGAARLFYRACQLTPEDKPRPVIIPVGLHYDKKSVFGSNALVAFHPSLRLDPELATPPPADTSYEEARKKYRRLTSELERVLREAVHPTESWELHQLLHRGRKLVRAEAAHRAGTRPDRPGMEERQLGFARLWQGYYLLLETHPRKVAELFAQVKDYDRHLRALGLQDHELDGVTHLRFLWVAGVLLLQWIVAYVLLPPLLLVGYVANFPTALLVAAVSKVASRGNKDEASMKLIVGAIAFPLTWLVIGVLVGRGVALLHPIYPTIPNAPFVTGLLALTLSALGGIVVVHYLRLARQTVRSLGVTLTRARRAEAIRRLRTQRSELYEAMNALAEGLDLSGMAAADAHAQAKSLP